MLQGRFAPSPTGRMHLGNVFSALLAWLSVRSAGGRMLLRIEDLDPDRSRPAYARQIREDLRWLGLDWDAESPPQSARAGAYQRAFERLRPLLYPCYCTRGQLHASAPHGLPGVYPGTCRALTEAQRAAQTRRPAWRIRVPDREICFTDGVFGPVRQNLSTECGDFILRRSDGVYAYQLAVVCDDGASGITQVVRGWDLLSSTPRQLYLMELLNLTPPEYYHVPLLTDDEGRRLSKRDADLDLGALSRRYTAPELTGRLAYAAGLIPEPEPLTPQQLLPRFSWTKLPRTATLPIRRCFPVEGQP